MKRLRQNFLRTVPVLTGYMVLGIGFGLLLQSRGYGIGWAFAMSAFLYAGSMQYVAVDLLASGANLVSVALTTLMVNARHLFYGISMLGKYKGTGAAKPYLIHGLTDETYSLVCTDDTLTRADHLQITALNQLYWVSGSLIGSVLGAAIPWDFKGLDFALTALFVTTLVEQWLSTKDHVPALVGLVASLACLLIFGADSFLIPSMIAITAALTLLRWLRKGGQDDV